MFCSRKLNTKINNLQYRALQIIYRDDISTFHDLLHRDDSVTIHYRNLRLLAIEMFKVVKSLAPSFMTDIFVPNINSNSVNISSNTRSHSKFYNPANPKTTNYGLETLRYLGPKIWNILPDDLKNAASICIFKNKIKGWIPVNCPCRLCLDYIPNLGYLQAT